MGYPYEIHPYSIASLKTILSAKSGALSSVVDRKLHSVYFENYFQDLGAKTVLVENDYVDRDFMEDYAGFYARCFGKYESLCTRLHFFKSAFTSRQFSYMLMGKGRRLRCRDLQDSYLGFVVVKKLPKTFIGRTCLETYDSDGGRRFYPTLRRYPVGLYGLRLTVERTLAFQEQDRGVAACATSALWSVFQGTGKLFQHEIPSPVEITRVATLLPDEAAPGTLPSRGLTGRQAISAMRNLGLEVEQTSAQDGFNLMGCVYAYLRAGIPLLMTVDLYDTSKPYDKHARLMGRHAIAVTGFSLGRSASLPYGPTQFVLRATHMDKLYVHDDQVGPFARMAMDGSKVTELTREGTLEWNSLSTSWRGENGQIGSVRAVPLYLLIPLYAKIRLRYEFIRRVMIEFDRFLRDVTRAAGLDCPVEYMWDIHLSTVNDFKVETRADPTLSSDAKRKVLLRSMPRFLWRARAYHDDRVFLELLFDATDIEQGDFCVCGIPYDATLFNLLRLAARMAASSSYYQTKPYWRIIEWFSKI